MMGDTTFWDRIAVKYRASPISDIEAYEATLERVTSHLGRDDRVLELGCGTGGTALRLAAHAGEIVATDFSPGMIAQAEAREGAEKVRFLAADAFDPRLEPGGFDAVMAFNLFHLVRDLPALIGRAGQLLAPGGLLISKTPCLTDPSARLHHRLMVLAIPLMQAIGKAPYVRFHTMAELERMIEAAGFRIVETGCYPVSPPSRFIVARKV